MLQLSLRSAGHDDELLLLRWANEASVRDMARSREPISAENHATWFASSLANPWRRIFIAMDGLTPLGQIRLDRRDNRAEIDISVDQRARNRGVATFMLNSSELWDWNGLLCLWGEVRQENTASRAIFLRCGFSETRSRSGFSLFERWKDQQNAD